MSPYESYWRDKLDDFIEWAKEEMPLLLIIVGYICWLFAPAFLVGFIVNIAFPFDPYAEFAFPWAFLAGIGMFVIDVFSVMLFWDYQSWRREKKLRKKDGK